MVDPDTSAHAKELENTKSNFASFSDLQNHPKVPEIGELKTLTRLIIVCEFFQSMILNFVSWLLALAMLALVLAKVRGWLWPP